MGLLKTEQKFLINKIIVFISIFLCIMIFFSCIFASYYNMKSDGELENCKENLKTISTALELYGEENKGKYPPALEKLGEEIPLCPLRSSILNNIFLPEDILETPSYGYEISKDRENFTLWCNTPEAHTITQKVNFSGSWPQYSREKGIILK